MGLAPGGGSPGFFPRALSCSRLSCPAPSLFYPWGIFALDKAAAKTRRLPKIRAPSKLGTAASRGWDADPEPPSRGRVWSRGRGNTKGSWRGTRISVPRRACAGWDPAGARGGSPRAEGAASELGRDGFQEGSSPFLPSPRNAGQPRGLRRIFGWTSAVMLSRGFSVPRCAMYRGPCGDQRGFLLPPGRDRRCPPILESVMFWLDIAWCGKQP